MLVSRGQLKRLILDEMTRLDEDCGCPGASPPPAGRDDYSLSIPHQEYDLGGKLLSREDALNIVMMVAANTSCPVTSDALMGVVEELSGVEGGHEGQSCDEAHPDEPHEQWASFGDFSDTMHDDEYSRSGG
tara:strand:+ start:85 stop:477 length:393 start_codon:yes stop_codon:yes gene_type:complete